MKGILIHSTTLSNLESILEDEYLYDSSRTEPEFGDGDVYTDLLNNKIFFQLVFETIPLTGNYNEDKGVSNPIVLLFDSKMIEEYGNKRYVKSEEEKKRIARFKDEKKKEKFIENEIPKSKVWFNPNWLHGGFHLINRKNREQSINYDSKISLSKNIEKFYKSKLQYIKDHIEDDREEYEELIEYYEGKEIPKEEEEWWKEHFKPEMPKTFINKAKNEVVFQSKRISVNYNKNLLAIYSYTSDISFKKIQDEYPDIKFLNSKKELKEFLNIYLS